ncbi:FkbM family methyltransferase [Alphaproteobacteria bacterium]|nr:FkbM family methyltransferase [Alphaproteobacteria bacterium]
MIKIIMAVFPSSIIRKIATLLSLVTSKLNGKNITGFLVQTEQFRFVVGSEDMSVGRALRVKGSYGDDEFKRISKLVKNESNVVFIGTHVGAIAIPTAKIVKSCILIEANPQTFDFLTTNIFLNEVTNATCKNVAIGECEDEINFVLSKVNSGGSKREPAVKDNMYYYDNPKTIKVPMVTLDSICSDETEVYDLIFMDIEGSEFFALQGMRNVLSRTNALVIEFIPHHLRNVATCSVEDFIGLIREYFNQCYVPSKDEYIDSKDFLTFFSKMFDAEDSDDGLIFTNQKVKF